MEPGINNTLNALRAQQSVHFNCYAKWDIWQTFNYLPSSRKLGWAARIMFLKIKDGLKKDGIYAAYVLGG